MTVEPFENAQPNEQQGQILVAVVDETYGVTEDDAWTQEREAYRLGLEAEFGVSFHDGDIGPGASLPAFITLLTDTAPVPIWSLLLAAFFLGDQLNKNLSAWAEIAKKLRSFFSRPVYVNRHGAAVMAIEAVFGQIGGSPSSVQLLSYRTQA